MAVRIAGVTLPQNKRIEIALTYIYGIGRTRAQQILAKAELSPNARTQNLTDDEANRLRAAIEHGGFMIEGDLRREVVAHIRRMKEIGSYRGSRHGKSLPARGQRTKTNSRTVRGNVRHTMGSGRRSAAQKT